MGQTWKDPKKGEKKINANGDHREVSHHVVYVSPLYIYIYICSGLFEKVNETKIWFSTKETQSSIHIGVSWVNQKEKKTGNIRLLCNFTISLSTPSNTLMF